MKTKEILVGGYYHDKKIGIREVVSIGKNDADTDVVEFRIISAKSAHEWDHRQGKKVSIIGTTSLCHLRAFATWAKTCLSKSECEEILLRLEARKITISPGENAFLRSVLDEVDGKVTAGLCVSTESSEKRAVTGLVKKGILTCDPEGGEVEFTDLGAILMDERMTK